MVWPAIVAGGAALAGKLVDNYFAGERADDAWDRTHSAYQHRYQDTMADMRAAGLNPILAAGSGGFNVGQGPVAPMAQVPSGDTASAFRNYMEGMKASEETKTQKVEQLKKFAEAKTEIERKYKVRAEAGKATADEKNAIAQMQEAWVRINKIREEVKIISKQKTLLNIEIKKITMALKELKAQSNVYDTGFGKVMKYIKALTEAFGLSTHATASGVSSASKVMMLK